MNISKATHDYLQRWKIDYQFTELSDNIALVHLLSHYYNTNPLKKSVSPKDSS